MLFYGEWTDVEITLWTVTSQGDDLTLVYAIQYLQLCTVVFSAEITFEYNATNHKLTIADESGNVHLLADQRHIARARAEDWLRGHDYALA